MNLRNLIGYESVSHAVSQQLRDLRGTSNQVWTVDDRGNEG